MKWWGALVFLVGIVAILCSLPGALFAESNILAWTILLAASALVLVAGLLLLIFLPYAGSRDEQRRAGRQDRAGLAIVAGALVSLVGLAILIHNWR